MRGECLALVKGHTFFSRPSYIRGTNPVNKASVFIHPCRYGNMAYNVLVYLMELHIWSGDVSGSMSSFKVKGQMYMQEKSPILTLGHNLWTSRERGFIFCMHIYFMELQKVSGRMSR